MAEDRAASSGDDSNRPEQPTGESESPPSNSAEPDNTPEDSAQGDEFIDEISDLLSGEGFGVFHGREFIYALGERPARTKLDGVQAVPQGEGGRHPGVQRRRQRDLDHSVEEDYDRTNVYSLQWNDDRVSMSVSGFLKQNNIKPDQTIRYPPEWDEDIGSEQVPGALVIDLDQEGEVSPAANDGSDEEAGEAEA